MELVVTVAKFMVVLLVVFAAFEDIRHMRIRNEICLALIALFIPVLFTLDLHGIGMHLLSAVLIFIVTAAMFYFGVFGGGDAKLIAALALWFTPAQLPLFLMSMALAGGVLGLVALALKHTNVLPAVATRFPKLVGPEDGWLASLARGQTVVPYGVAIAFACIVTIF